MLFISSVNCCLAIPRPDVFVLNALSDTSIFQLLFSSVLSISNCKASISPLRSLIKDLVVLYCTPLSSILTLNLSLPVCSCFVAFTFFLKDTMVFPGYVSYNDTFVTTVFVDSILPLT